MRFLPAIALLVFFSCGQNRDGEKKDSPGNDSISPLTDTVTKVVSLTPPQASNPDYDAIHETLKGTGNSQWHVLNDQEAGWMKDAFDYFIVPRRKENPNYPYIAKGDFNADGRRDMAAVVTDSLKRKYQVAVVLGPDQVVFWDEDISAEAALSAEPPGEVLGMDGEKTKKIRMKGDGINVEYFERASFVLYWDKKSFKRLQTGD